MTLGESVLRIDDGPLLRGTERFAGDVQMAGQWSASIVRSPLAHAKILGIETDEARTLPGVIAVFTAEDIASDLGEVPIIKTRVSYADAVVPYLQPVLAVDRVRYVGEPLAIVIAENRYVAEDAVELVFADLEILPAVVDGRTAVEQEPLFELGNEVTILRTGFGDVDRDFAAADVVIEKELSTGRHTGVPMETRGLVAEYGENDRLTVHGSAKVPHYNRWQLATHLGMPEGNIRMIEMAVGGGFGVRGEYYPEDFLVPWAARTLKGTVSWIEDRREHLLACNHSRQQHHLCAIAGTNDGRILGLRTEFWADMGGFVRTHGIRVPSLTMSMLPGPYDLASYDAVAHLVVTNKTPIGTYRAPGRFESCFVRERLVDAFADAIDMDPVQVRRLNLIPADRFPYTRTFLPSGERFVFAEGHELLLDKVSALVPYQEVAARRAGGACLGVGLAMFMEKGGVGPWETGSVTITSESGVIVRSGCTSVGQGIRTVLAQVAADVLALPTSRIRVELVDTDETARGVGTFGSRGTTMAGNAVHMAATTVLKEARARAAESLEASPEDLVLRDGGFEVKGSPETRISLAQIAASSPEGKLEHEETFYIEEGSFPYGVHAAIVTVDREIGAVSVEKMIVGYEVGRAVNPQLIEGQLHGAALQGIGGALLERFDYDDNAVPLVTSLMDYLIPTMSEAPVFECFVSEEAPAWHNNPLGVKGAGEGGVPGAAAAIAAAVDDALGSPGFVTTTPVDPALIASAEHP